MKLRVIFGAAAMAGALVSIQGGLAAQAPAPQQQQGPPQTGQARALFDLSGTWVSVVNSDWRFRMMTPPKGDYGQLPLSQAGRKVADQFDPAQYGGDNYQISGIVDCRAYGAFGVMRMPTRLRISWATPDQLKIEGDWGQQTRVLNFASGRPYGDLEQAIRNGEVGASRGAASMQGNSLAMWEQAYRQNANLFQQARGPQGGRGGGGGGLDGPAGTVSQLGGNLAVITTDLLPGWMRRNGVTYSARTRMIERYMAYQDPTGAQWFTVVIELIDPEYLNTPLVVSADFRKEPDNSKWAPHPCKQVAAN